MKTKELNVCPHCGKKDFLEDEFFKDMVEYGLFEGHIPCISCHKLTAVRLTKSGELISIKKKEPLTLEEIREWF